MSDINANVLATEAAETIEELAESASGLLNDVDTDRVLRYGSYLAMALVFVSLVGMAVGLDGRQILFWINPDVYVNHPDGQGLSLGDVALWMWPLLLGWAATNEVVLEGMQARARGVSDLVTGFLVGAIGGLGISLLTFLMNVDREINPENGVPSYGVRDPLVNWNEQLYVMLTFNRGWTFALWAWPLLAGIVAMFGAGLRVISDPIRKAITAALVSVLSVSVFQFLVDDLLEGVGETIADPGRISNFFESDPSLGRPRVDSAFDPLIDFLYAKTGGLKLEGMILVAIVAAGLSLVASYVVRGRVKQARQAYFDRPLAERTRSSALLMVAVALALLIVPFFTGSIINELLANVGIFLLLALGLNIVVGLAGILDLGYVAFFAVGGYTTAVLTSAGRGESWPSWVPLLVDEGEPVLGGWLIALVLVMVFAGLTGLLIGAPVIRMRGDYLAIVTLGFGEIIRLLFLSDWLKGYFGGAQGITNIEGADFGPIGTVTGVEPRSVFYLVAVFAAIAIYVSWRLERSRLGRAWMAIREDESVAEAMGINTVNMKLMAFVVGAVLASFAGAIFSAKVGSIFPTSFLILVSIIILVVVIVGGMGNIMGVIAGSLVLIGVLGGPKQPGLLQEFSEYKLLIYGVLLVWMMLQRPEGLVPNVRRSRELHQEEFLQDAWLKGEVDTDDEGDDVATEVAPA